MCFQIKMEPSVSKLWRSCVHTVYRCPTKRVVNRVLTRILKIGVKMLSTRKVLSFTFSYFSVVNYEKVGVRNKKLE